MATACSLTKPANTPRQRMKMPLWPLLQTLCLDASISTKALRVLVTQHLGCVKLLRLCPQEDLHRTNEERNDHCMATMMYVVELRVSSNRRHIVSGVQ